MHQEQIFNNLQSRTQFSRRPRFTGRMMKPKLDDKGCPLSQIQEEETITSHSGETQFMSALESDVSTTPYLSCYNESKTKKRKIGETSF
jgi:hypothetical protein